MLDFEELRDRDLAEAPFSSEDEGAEAMVFTKPVPLASQGTKQSKAPPSINRKPQVLLLYGRQSNNTLFSFQTTGLRNTLKDCDIHWLDADMVWQFEENKDLHDVDDMTKAISKGKEFYTWFEQDCDDARVRPDCWKLFDPSVKVHYRTGEPERAVDKLLSYVNEKGPIDVIGTLFEGSMLVHLAIARLISEGKDIPWKLSVFFGAQPIRDASYAQAFQGKIAHPTFFVFMKLEHYYHFTRTGAGMKASEDYYENPIIMETLDTHAMPSIQPRATEVYERIHDEINWRCGLRKEKPKKVATPPKPFTFPILNLVGMLARKIRVLAMAGGHAREEIIQFQTTPLRMALGKDNAEWTFLHGFKEWTYYKGEPVPSEFEEKIAAGKQLYNYYLDKAHDDRDITNAKKQFDPNVFVEYYDFQESIDQFKTYIEENGPFDVIVAFSQAAIFLHGVMSSIRRSPIADKTREDNYRNSPDVMPWRITLMFNGMHVRDKRYFEWFDGPKLKHPTVMVYGTEDEFYDYSKDGFGNKPQHEYYEDPIMMEHGQDHVFPTVNPRAKEIYDRCVAEIWKHCGGRPTL